MKKNICLKCGKCCCQGVEIDIEEAKDLLKKYPEFILHEFKIDKDFPSGFCVSSCKNSARCIFLKKRLCSIYKDRPYFCRNFIKRKKYHTDFIQKKCWMLKKIKK